MQLEENIREKCDEAFKEKITLQEERDLFVRCDPDFLVTCPLLR